MRASRKWDCKYLRNWIRINSNKFECKDFPKIVVSILHEWLRKRGGGRFGEREAWRAWSSGVKNRPVKSFASSLFLRRDVSIFFPLTIFHRTYFLDLVICDVSQNFGINPITQPARDSQRNAHCITMLLFPSILQVVRLRNVTVYF